MKERQRGRSDPTHSVGVKERSREAESVCIGERVEGKEGCRMLKMKPPNVVFRAYVS
jgi:hypothetical protein